MNNSTSPNVATPYTPPQNPSAFERWRRQAMLVTGLGVTEDERMEALRAHQTRQCEKRKEYFMHNSESWCFPS